MSEQDKIAVLAVRLTDAGHVDQALIQSAPRNIRKFWV